ncbi:uncharacterized protein F4812DRAFT_442276 [Daldinia caldariorum]|uniref:uncharacterized protein n=1 Tax=Daldinia caldariorum TaxID=326644 RepID=UPI00200794C8|nr:uncharacterized protein F4812DRAFT_442276 [Daldinia caldariorum]KAI1464476.1 hypothetical protein F4812DRAFT_442276 [Daldinia caldariorum]
MRSASVVAGMAALTATAQGGPLPRSDPYVGDMRTFSTVGCLANNQGVSTVTESMTGACQRQADPFSSMYLYMNSGWVFRAHGDPECKDEGNVILTSVVGRPFVCNNHTSAWTAYLVSPLNLGKA